ncbi:hypothetical protein CXB51_003100 [Gossypium anomalum]|uniref:Integrase catalytic domain-containing protein n=1 Tax=Gossypium anomalum TaxID=47600 RepID=A0A8J5ZFD7_9ROSI|nr:hypothetical protein CXB51_003100 [Gossypium anomalum]
MVKTQFGKDIKSFQSDWGGEYCAFTSVLASLGILHHLSCPHTYEQNGVAKRKNRYIVETGLTLLAHANLPMTYWGYVFCSAVYLINRLPTPVLKGYQCLTPYGKVNVSRHAVFDERCFLFSSSIVDRADNSACVPTYVPLVCPTVSHPCTTFESPTSVQVPTPQPTPQYSPIPTDSVAELGTAPSITRCHSPTLVLVISSPSISVRNAHNMITRSKAGIFKPKALSIKAIAYEPCTVEEALADSAWRPAVQVEYDALINNYTWKLVPLPPGRKVPGCDFKKTSSPMVKPTTIQTILSVAISRGWQIRQVDVNNAFLNGDLTDEKFMVFTEFLVSKSDAFLFIRVTTNSVLYVLVYVDDIIVTGSIEVARSPSGSLHLCQRKYIRELLDRSILNNAKNVHTPMISSSTLSKDKGDRPADPTEYRSLAGALQYVVLTQPNISYACSKKQQAVFRSTVEAEYRSLAAATSDVTWLVSLLTELQISSVDLPNIWCDNSGAITVAANPVLHSKLKHVELDIFFVREKVTQGAIVVDEVPACDQVADIFTKPLSVSCSLDFESSRPCAGVRYRLRPSRLYAGELL